MEGMRIRHTALALTLVLAPAWVTPAWADAAPSNAANPPPRTASERDESHRFSPVLQGALGGASLALLVAGGALVASTAIDFQAQRVGGRGASCRPCSTSALTNLQGREYGGYAMIAIGGALAITDIVLLVLDYKHRNTPQGVDGKTVAQRTDFAAGIRF